MKVNYAPNFLINIGREGSNYECYQFATTSLKLLGINKCSTPTTPGIFNYTYRK